MAKQNKAQREYVRDVRTHNSINYYARSTKPRSLRNIDIILKTMKYNELSDDANSREANRVKAINTGLLIFTIAFELLVLSARTMAFLLTFGQKRRGYRRSW